MNDRLPTKFRYHKEIMSSHFFYSVLGTESEINKNKLKFRLTSTCKIYKTTELIDKKFR